MNNQEFKNVNCLKLMPVCRVCSAQSMNNYNDSDGK